MFLNHRFLTLSPRDRFLSFPPNRQHLVLTFCLLLAISALLPAPAAHANSVVYRQTLRSTVWIVARDGEETVTGSGVLIDRDQRLVLTNAHVLGTARSATVYFPRSRQGVVIAERESYLDSKAPASQGATRGIQAVVERSDPRRDLLLLKLSSLPANAVAIRRASRSVGPGDALHSVGNPTVSGVLWNYTSGTVRAVYQKKFTTTLASYDMRVVETQTPINPGDSGGPVVNSAGELVALTQSLNSKARLLSYCIDRSEIETFLSASIAPARGLRSPPRAEPRNDKNNLNGDGNDDFAARLTKAGWTVSRGKGEPYFVSIRNSRGELSKVYLASRVETFAGQRTRRIWSVAARYPRAIPAELATAILEENGRTRAGSWLIERRASGESWLVFSLTIHADAGVESLREAANYVERMAARRMEPATTPLPSP